MRQIIIENPKEPRGASIIDYPISVASEDKNGNYITSSETGEYITTGETLEWSIRPGEKLIFDEYVGRVLSDRYHFLKLCCIKCGDEFSFENSSLGTVSAYQGFLAHQCKSGKNKVDADKALDAKESGILYCKYCEGEEAIKEYKGRVQLAMHIGSKHQDVDL